MFELKGYGQSDKRDGDYTWENVADEALALFDSLHIERFNVTAHDRGAVLVDYWVGKHPGRVLRYLRLSQLVHLWELE